MQIFNCISPTPNWTVLLFIFFLLKLLSNIYWVKLEWEKSILCSSFFFFYKTWFRWQFKQHIHSFNRFWLVGLPSDSLHPFIFNKAQTTYRIILVFITELQWREIFPKKNWCQINCLKIKQDPKSQCDANIHWINNEGW